MRRIFATLVMLSLVFCFACDAKRYRPTKLPPARNAVLISIDMLRADHLGTYGYSKPTSPNLDKLAKEAIRFDRAYSSSNWTLPGHAGMLTGRMSSWHGGIQLHDAIRESVPLVSQVLQARGVRTAALTSHIYVSPRYGFERGFDYFEFEQNRAAPVITDKAVAWLETQGDEPFFLFLHYFDVHNPFGQGGAPVGRFTSDPECRGPVTVHEAVAAAYQENWDAFDCITALYDADIALVDRELGRLFEYLKHRGLLEETLLIVTSDHGELLGKGEGVTHGLTLREPEIRVPLLIRFPGAAAGNTAVPHLVSNIQLTPTILESMGAPAFDTDLPSLFPLLAGGAPPTWLGVETDSIRYQQIGIVGERYKLILPPTYHIMDTRLAPMLIDIKGSEEENLWEKHPERVRDMLGRAEQSGWYGRGTCHEFVHRFGPDVGPVKLRFSFPEDRPPVYVRPWRRAVQVKPGGFFDVWPHLRRSPGTIELRLKPGEHPMGIVFVMPEGVQARAEVFFSGAQRPAVLWGEEKTEWDGASKGLPTEAGAWQAVTRPDGAFIQARSYRVLDLERPNGGRSGVPVDLTNDEERDLRTLGYLGM
ncbi:MAG: sulfatase [Candidatus Lernaella stagnicola]|nr:sulfatase [Candidatus Lernaella stagnicola]